MSNTHDHDDVLNQFWNALIGAERDATEADLPRKADLPPEEIAVVHRLQRAGNALLAGRTAEAAWPRVLARLEAYRGTREDPMTRTHAMLISTPMMLPNGRSVDRDASARGRIPARVPDRSIWGRFAVASLLVLTIATGLVMFGSWRPGAPESPGSHLAAISAQQPEVATPAASPEAPTALVEFAAEIRLGPGPSSTPAGMAIDADGTLYVIDAIQGQIRLFDRDGQPVATWGKTGEEPGQFRFHGEGGFWGDLAIGPDGNLYVLDPFNSRIQVLSPDGAFIREWGEAGDGEGQFAEPIGLAVDQAGRVYVADTDNGRVQIFDANGQFLEAWVPSGDGETLPSSPANIEVDAAGIVSVTDWNTNPIIRLDANGTVMGTFGGAETAPEQLAGPWGMASDGQGNLFVADSPGNRIQVFAPDGTLLGTIGSAGVQPGQFISPKYVALSADGLLYVAEEGNRRVQIFRLLPPLGAALATPAANR